MSLIHRRGRRLPPERLHRLASVEVKARPEEVWPILEDPASAKSDPGVYSSTWVPGLGAGVGACQVSIGRTAEGRPFAVVLQITAHDPPRSAEYESISGVPLRQGMRVELQPTPEGTQVTHHSWVDLPAGLPRQTRELVDERMKRSLEDLCSWVESRF